MGKGFITNSMYDIFQSEKDRLSKSECPSDREIDLFYNELKRIIQYSLENSNGGKDVLTMIIDKDGGEEGYFKAANDNSKGIGTPIYACYEHGTNSSSFDVRYMERNMPKGLQAILLDYAQRRDELNLEKWTDPSKKPEMTEGVTYMDR